MAKKSSTIKDVATHAGVSASTVSRILNKRATGVRIASETRRRVMRVARDLGYRPNRLARGLITSKTHIIGIDLPLLVPADSQFHYDVPLGERMGYAVVGAFIVGIQSVAYPRGYEFHVYAKTGADTAADGFGHLAADFVDGLIFVLSLPDEAPSKVLDELGVPACAIFFYRPRSEVPCAFIDSRHEAYRLCRAWLSAGHRHFGLILPNSDEDGTIEEGFLQALGEAGFSGAESLTTVTGHLARGTGRKLARRLMNKRPRPTAIFVGRADNAVDVLAELKEMGLRCPTDVELVVWCDDHAFEATDPPLSALDVPFHLLGARAAEMLFNAMEAGEEAKQRQVLVPCRLVERKSSTIGSWFDFRRGANLEKGGEKEALR